MKSWNDLLDDLEERMKSDLEPGMRYPEDTIAEIVDGLVPVYNQDRIDLLADNHDLACPEEWEVCLDGATDIYDILGRAIYFELQKESYVILERIKEQWEEWDEAESELSSDADALIIDVEVGDITKEEAEERFAKYSERCDLPEDRIHIVEKQFREDLAAAEVPEVEDDSQL